MNNFNYNNFSNLLNIYKLDKINEQLEKIFKNKDYIIINKKLYKYKIKTDADLVLIYGADDFNIVISGFFQIRDQKFWNLIVAVPVGFPAAFFSPGTQM